MLKEGKLGSNFWKKVLLTELVCWCCMVNRASPAFFFGLCNERAVVLVFTIKAPPVCYTFCDSFKTINGYGYILIVAGTIIRPCVNVEFYGIHKFSVPFKKKIVGDLIGTHGKRKPLCGAIVTRCVF